MHLVTINGLDNCLPKALITSLWWRSLYEDARTLSSGRKLGHWEHALEVVQPSPFPILLSDHQEKEMFLLLHVMVYWYIIDPKAMVQPTESSKIVNQNKMLSPCKLASSYLSLQ